MRSGVPWSVKGIEPEAREAAKQAARRAGVTLGAWLNQIIMDGGTDEVGMPGADVSLTPGAKSQNFAQSVFSQPVARETVDLAPVAEAVREIVTRVEQSERRTQDLARKLEQSVGHIAERLERSERSAERQMENAMPDPRTLDPLERKIQMLSERLEEAERGRGSMARKGSDLAQIQTLEKAVNAVVDHLETAERRSEDSLADIRRTLSEIATRVDARDQEDEREEALARERAMTTHLQTLASRLEKMETSVSGVGGQAVEAALKAIAEKNDAEQHKATIAHLQRSLGEITQRLERAEQRTDETLKTFEMTVTGIARRLEELDNPRERAAVQAVESRIEDIANRLHQTEDMTLQAAQTIERAIAGMSDSMHVAENRSRETIDSLHVMLERMTDRLGRIERETKATRSSLTQGAMPGMLPPQLAVGGAMGGGFVPGGQAFPIPNFDAPSIGTAGGGYGPVTEYREPGLREPGLREPGLREHGLREHGHAESYRETPPPVTAEHTFAPDVPPPPFAPESDPDGRREPTLVTRSMPEPEDEEPAHDEPVMEPQRAANDFMAAARRAAQAAAMNGRGGPQPMMGPNGYAESPARFTAVDTGEGRRKKIIYGAVAAVLLIAVALGALRLMNDEPVIVTKVGPSAPAIEKTADAAAPADMGASTETAKPSTVPAPTQPETVQSSNTAHPEATPEDAGAKAKAAAPASTTTPVSPLVPAAKPATAEKAATPAPKKQTARETSGPAITPGPMLTPAPSKPVDSAPLANVPPSERALRSAAASGNPAAQYEVGQRYANGENVPQDLSQAAYWYNQAADQGLAIAQYRLATLYEKGRGVPQDNEKARSWYEKAATQGNVKAMHNLAVIYAEGRGTRQDFTTASRWFGQAADFGLGDSQYNLAILQERGLGVKQDLVSSYKWLSIAAKGGDKGAAQKRDELAGKLDAATLAQAKVAAETWSPKRPDPVANGDLSSMGSWATPSSDVTGSIEPTGTLNDTARAQAMLIKLGYDPGSSDGLMGPRTRDAILSYQRSAGLDQTGGVNPALLKSLEIATR